MPTQTSPLCALDEAVARFAGLTLAPGEHVANYNLVVGRLHEMVTCIIACEAEGIEAAAILEHLEPARRFHSQAPFIHRCQTWPRGFPGDYETIEYLYYAKNHAPPDTIAYYCEEYALLSACTQQHRNKLHVQAQRVMSLVTQATAPVRVLSLAGGSSLELQPLASLLAGSDLELVLNDTDEDALNAALAGLAPLKPRTIVGNVVEVLAWEAEELGAFDLVLAGGLFDYLSDKHIGFLFRNMRDCLLKPGGQLFFTNIACDNPYRPWMTYLADWPLLERSADDLQRLAKKAKFGDGALSLEKDASRLTWLATLTA